ncbi:MAG: radical SAM protein [Chitinispirillaceae bacterium]|nr:radical SAM protein [Chitinispirillaceae bacterium]
MEYRHLFGPVRSRRLGSSLGVDMVPFKTCNCNCVYCECGATRAVSHTRAEFVGSTELIGELGSYLADTPELDYITFAGSGEPTLNSAIGTVLRYVKNTFPNYRTALLTNGTLFHLEDVRRDILPFDLVLPSLDAVSSEVFHRINRPHCGLDVKKMIDGIVEFSREYRGMLWIEVFIIPGINDTPEELAGFKDVLKNIQPSRVQLNSLDRPGACDWVKPPEPGALASIAEYLKPLPVEIISRSGQNSVTPLTYAENLEGTVIHQLRRRPATIEEIAVMCSATINEIEPAIKKLVILRKLSAAVVNGKTFYRVNASP